MSIRVICGLFGKTRQAWYERSKTHQRRLFETQLILDWVDDIRNNLPRLGMRKLYHLLKPAFEEHQIRIGRDKFWRMLQQNNRLVPTRRRRGIRTTWSNHKFRKWPYLLEGFQPQRPEELWVTDITYLYLKDGFAYLSLVTDSYSKMIVGYHLSPNLGTSGPIRALQMALNGRTSTGKRLIHHSDRGIQYCSSTYIKKLQENGIQVSMTRNGEPTENAVAERVNGILKGELALNTTFKSLEQAQTGVASAVFRYNFLRPHSSCNYLTPAQACQKSGPMKKKWKPEPIP